MEQRTIGILIFDGVEILDFTGPFEVFSVAGQVAADSDGAPAFTVVTIAEERKQIAATGGLRVEPEATIDAHPDIDVLVIPGGIGTRTLHDHTPVIDWIRAQSTRVSLMTSVCTGAFLLGSAGILEGRAATTHWASIHRMREVFPSVTVREDTRFVEDGAIVTAAGVSAGIDMSLAIVSRLLGDDVARKTARYMEYERRP